MVTNNKSVASDNYKYGLLRVFEKHMPGLKFDTKLYDKISKYRFNWATKNSSRTEFLGGNTMGTTRFVYTDSEVEDLVVTILNVDLNNLRKDIHALDGIDPTRNVTSNPFFLLLMYLMHGFMASQYLKTDLKEKAVTEIYYIFAYRVVSSLFVPRFRYLLDKETALAATERLSKKFLTKQYGTWQNVFTYRAEAIAKKDGLHHDRIAEFDIDEVQRVVADLQGRLRAMVGNIYAVINEVKEEKEKIAKTSLHDTIGEKETIADIKDRRDIYVKYIKSIVYKPADFIKSDIVMLVDKLTGSVGNSDLSVMLSFMSENYVTLSPDIDAIIEGTLESFIEYMKRREVSSDYNKDIAKVVIATKNYYSSSKISDQNVEIAKDKLSSIYQKATKKHNKTALAGARIKVMLYVVIRAVAMKTYS